MKKIVYDKGRVKLSQLVTLHKRKEKCKSNYDNKRYRFFYWKGGIKMRKYRFNEEKFLRNFAIFTSGVTIGILIYKIATCGISWISTIGYLG